MVKELVPGGLEGIHGQVSYKDYRTLSDNSETLDYSAIEAEFAKAGKKLPLTASEMIGLTEEQKREINPCGTCCGGCEDYGVVCDGCRNRNGVPLWYHLYDRKEPCCFYQCCENNGKHDCSQCKQLPCKNFFEYPDPNMSNEFKQWWFALRMKNLNQLRTNDFVEVEDDFEKNVRRYIWENNQRG